jgi:hypothetical protein
MTHSRMEESAAEETLTQFTNEEIQARAYELWQQRGCPEGSPEVDWLAAENQILNG